MTSFFFVLFTSDLGTSSVKQEPLTDEEAEPDLEIDVAEAGTVEGWLDFHPCLVLYTRKVLAQRSPCP